MWQHELARQLRHHALQDGELVVVRQVLHGLAAVVDDVEESDLQLAEDALFLAALPDVRVHDATPRSLDWMALPSGPRANTSPLRMVPASAAGVLRPEDSRQLVRVVISITPVSRTLARPVAQHADLLVLGKKIRLWAPSIFADITWSSSSNRTLSGSISL